MKVMSEHEEYPVSSADSARAKTMLYLRKVVRVGVLRENVVVGSSRIDAWRWWLELRHGVRCIEENVYTSLKPRLTLSSTLNSS